MKLDMAARSLILVSVSKNERPPLNSSPICPRKILVSIFELRVPKGLTPKLEGGGGSKRSKKVFIARPSASKFVLTEKRAHKCLPNKGLGGLKGKIWHQGRCRTSICLHNFRREKGEKVRHLVTQAYLKKRRCI